MNWRQEDKLSMYFTVKNYMKKNKSAWSSFVPLSNAYNKFSQKIDEIIETSTHQTEIIKGKAINKRQKRDAMIEVALRIGAVITAYAAELGNNELMHTVNYKKRQLVLSRDTIVNALCKIILDEAKNNAPDLIDYGITSVEIAEFETAIAQYHQTIADPREAIVSRGTYTELLNQLFKQADFVLKNEIDNLMIVYKTTKPDFYATYKESRKIIDL